MAQAIARIREQGAAAVPTRPATLEAPDPLFETPERDPRRFDSWLVAPRAAAVAVMGMLGFGVIVGSLVGESSASTTSPLIVAERPHHSSAAPQATGSLSSGGGGTGGGGAQTQTITVGSTTPAPSSSGSGGGSQAAAAGAAPTTTSTTTSSGTLPPIRHVFVITLSDEGYNQTFGHTGDDPYLAKKLASQGEVLTNYYSVAGGSLANEIAMVSGQGPTPDTVDDCPSYTNVEPANKGARGQILGNGCVYPRHAQTLAGELEAAKLSWKAYVQTNTTGARARLQACAHPAPGGAGAQPSLQDPYAAWRNPFLYFRPLVAKRSCAQHDVPLAQLSSDLKSATKTPSLAWIVPDVCDDGSVSPCAAGALSGMGPADSFLQSVVPKIKRSKAYKKGGLIVITFDQAPQTGPNADPSSCCDNPTYPNLPPPAPPAPPATTTTGTTTATPATPATPTTPTTTTTTTTGTTGTTSPTTTRPGAAVRSGCC